MLSSRSALAVLRIFDIGIPATIWLALCTTVNAQINLQQKADAYYDLGVANTILGNYESAIGNYDAVISLDPNYDQAYSDRCWVRAVIGRELERALVDCNQVLRLNPNNIHVFDHRGFTYLKLGKFDRSIADYDTLLKHEPNMASSLYGRGLAKQKMGNRSGGDIDIAAAKVIQANIADQFAKYGIQP
jgi:tetratricopeptide (TPR) repeat protein